MLFYILHYIYTDTGGYKPALCVCFDYFIDLHLPYKSKTDGSCSCHMPFCGVYDSSDGHRVYDCQGEEGYYYSLRILDEVRHLPLDKILYFEAAGRNYQVRIHIEDEIIDFMPASKNSRKNWGRGFGAATQRVPDEHLSCEPHFYEDG